MLIKGKEKNTAQVIHELLERLSQLPQVDIRFDFEVFKMIVMGQSISAIGEQLSLNVNTISTYRSRIMEKMNMKTNADLVKYAILNNII